MQPMEVVELLNAFFDVMCPVLKAEAADIDKFIGDAIMALFDELPDGDPAPLRAVRSALSMQAALREWNAQARRATPLDIRIGVNIGRVVRGDIGSRHVRRDYTVIGDVVNRAQRFEANAPKGGVLVGEQTYLATRDYIDYEARPGMMLKGVAQPVNAYVALRMLQGETRERRFACSSPTTRCSCARRSRSCSTADARFDVIGEAKDGRDAVEKVQALQSRRLHHGLQHAESRRRRRGARDHAHCTRRPSSCCRRTRAQGAKETFEALAAGAVDFLAKPSGEVSAELGAGRHRAAREGRRRRAVEADADGARAPPRAAPAAPHRAARRRRRRAEGRRRRRLDRRTGRARPLLAALSRPTPRSRSSSCSTCPPASPPRSPSGSTACAPSACARPPTATARKPAWR